MASSCDSLWLTGWSRSDGVQIPSLCLEIFVLLLSFLEPCCRLSTWQKSQASPPEMAKPHGGGPAIPAVRATPFLCQSASTRSISWSVSWRSLDEIRRNLLICSSLWKSKCICFKPKSFGVVCYGAIADWENHNPLFPFCCLDISKFS